MSIDFRKNANVLTGLLGFAKPKDRTAVDPYVVDGYELRADPALVTRLKELMAYAPEADLEYVYGTPVLCTSKGRVFAIAGGGTTLNLYLSETEAWGVPHAQYGKPWRRGYAWMVGRPRIPEDEEQFAALVRSACAAAMKVDHTNE